MFLFDAMPSNQPVLVTIILPDHFNCRIEERFVTLATIDAKS